MKRKTIIKTVVCILVAVLMFQSGSYVAAHPYSQEGILARTYHTEYEGYYVGGESIGWSIDENYHTDGTTLTYSFSSSDPYLDSTYRSYVTTGASLWSGIVTITNKSDGTGTGEISTFYNPNVGVVAQFYEYSADTSGHLTSWKIQINRAKNVNATVIAHEFGHAIGLNDLYEDQNIDKLMYGLTSGTATSPTTSDAWGAKVITGVHTTHTWEYTYHSTTGTGQNRHVGYCTSCNGRTADIYECVYDDRNFCIFCRMRLGMQPWSIGHEHDTE